jgi:hypothetical protein
MRTIAVLLVVAAVSTARAGSEAEHVVVTHVAADDPFHAVAERVAMHRKAEVLAFDPADLEPLRTALAERAPRFVTVVAKPEVIDTNFIRRFLMMSTKLDEDFFPDFAWGLVTGATAADALKFFEGIVKAENVGLPKRFLRSFVTSQCSAAGDSGPSWLKKAGWITDALGLGYEDRGALEEFAPAHLPDLAGRGLIQMTGCGDPERIWLFSDQRNMDRAKHWPYDPAKVGQNPGDEMFWIDAPMLAGLDLWPAVLTSGTCHCGSLDRVFVEGDIVSTFGTSEKVEVYRIPPGKSLGLAYLASGVTAAILPVGPNHGWRTNVEVCRMFATGAPLGEVMKSCYDELVLANGGEVKLGLYDEAGNDADHGIQAIMQGGAANRVLYGDPAFAPFPKVEGLASPVVRGPAKGPDGALRFEVEVTQPFAYGEMTGADCVDQFNRFASRLLAAADLPADLTPHGIASVALAGDPEEGIAASVAEIRWAMEVRGDASRLHVAAFSKTAAGRPGGLGTEKGQKLAFRAVPAATEADRRWAGVVKVREEAGQVEAALDQSWGYEWKDRRFADILKFVSDFLAKHGDGQKVTFEFDDDARDAAEKKVSMKLDHEPLRAGLERACKELGLAMKVDAKRNVVRFSRVK